MQYLSARLGLRCTVAVAATMLLSLMAGESHANVIYRAGLNTGATPQTYEANQGWNSAQFTQIIQRSDAGPLGLESTLGVQATTIDNFYTGIEVRDVVVSSTDPAATHAEISFGASVTGSFTGVGNATAILGLGVSGLGVLLQQGGTNFKSSDGDVTIVPVYLAATVPVDTPFTVVALLELRASSLFGNRMVLDFDVEFDLPSVFLLPEGVSVDSPSWGLVNNSLVGGDDDPQVGTVPEPASLGLLLLALLSGTAAFRLRPSPR